MTEPRNFEDLDEYDRIILKILQEDGKTPLWMISEKLENELMDKKKKPLGKTSIQARIKKMQESEIIEKYMVIVNCHKIGMKEMLMASLRLTRPVKEVANKIKDVEKIKYIYITSGEYPLFLMAKCFGHQELLEIVEKLQKIEGVEEVKTEIVMDCIKEDHSIHIS